MAFINELCSATISLIITCKTDGIWRPLGCGVYWLKEVSWAIETRFFNIQQESLLARAFPCQATCYGFTRHTWDTQPKCALLATHMKLHFLTHILCSQASRRSVRRVEVTVRLCCNICFPLLLSRWLNIHVHHSWTSSLLVSNACCHIPKFAGHRPAKHKMHCAIIVGQCNIFLCDMPAIDKLSLLSHYKQTSWLHTCLWPFYILPHRLLMHSNICYHLICYLGGQMIVFFNLQLQLWILTW